MARGPVVSFGVPVRNGVPRLERLLKSLRDQTVSDLEVVVCDNRSDDATQDLVREISKQDPRIRLEVNETDIGQIGNFNRVFELSRGKYFRWIGADDWLEPEYAERCVGVLERDSNLVAVTTYQDHVDDDGNRHYVEYKGPRLESPRPSVRARRMLWFFHADYGYIDPIYTIMRQETLLRSHLLQLVPRTDQVLSLEIAMLGPFGHVPECLAHRRREHLSHGSDAILRRYHPTRYDELRVSIPRVGRAFLSVVESAPLPSLEKVLCRLAVLRWGIGCSFRDTRRALRGTASNAVRRLLPRR